MRYAEKHNEILNVYTNQTRLSNKYQAYNFLF